MKQQSDLTVEQLREENARLLALLAQQESTIETLRHQLHLFRNARFGRKSEKGVVPEQMALQFDEAEPSSEQDESTVEPSQTETITYTRAKKAQAAKHCPSHYPMLSRFMT
ncbi:Transposase and inactivated derivatives [Legionella israelensis]|uniref:IS66 family transposase n=1 Tax=Legionella israelensis TaxID=454 RepID=UPI000DFB0C80|nr:hypothetical protein [Legionella israelensis]STX57434.1 Transposase and inactivated derivatives [Legionella israelensis]